MDDISKDSKPPAPGSDIRPISIADEMRRSYLDYAMSVIVSRALPDVRDGLKPVHRRILFSMYENKYTPDRPYNKSARVTGDTMGKYHPHGNLAIYEALVRMAQPFSMRLPLIDGQGNFGSVDGDPPAAERYTEVRLAHPTLTLLGDLDKDTVAFQPNYDGREEEPMVLPARFPNLLINGAGGIAVGMATNIPPHNLGEVIDGVIALMDNPDMSITELMRIIPGPDFPTGGAILGRSGIKSAYETGRGSIMIRSKLTIDQIRKDRQAIIISELPYQVNKATLQEKMAELVREKKLEGISEIRDESDRDGMRLVVELKRDAVADVVVNQLWRHTAMQTSFSANMIALNGGRPELLTVRDILKAFIDFRLEVVTRRTKFLLNKARDAAHQQVGLAIAVANIDEVIRLIRTSPDAASARTALMARAWPAKDMAPLVSLIADPRHRLSDEGEIHLSEAQARGILELRLQRLTALGREEISENLGKLATEISEYLEILSSSARLYALVQQELLEIKTTYATPRRTEIIEQEGELEDLDLIQREDMVVTVSHTGYIKRVPLSTYRAQRRGGKGLSGMQMREEDFVARLFIATTHQPVLFFSSRGQVYKEMVWRLPLASRQSLGKFLRNILPLHEGERITTIMPLPEDQTEWEGLDIIFATTSGSVRRNKLSDFTQVNRSGKMAMRLEEDESIVGVQLCTDEDDILLTSAQGMSIRFPVSKTRVFKSRDSVGVRGIQLSEGDHVISLAVLNHMSITFQERNAYFKMRRQELAANGDEEASEEDLDLEEEFTEENGEQETQDLQETQDESDSFILSPERYTALKEAEQFILTVSTNGFGKRTSSYEFRLTGRGMKGFTSMPVDTRHGSLIASFSVGSEDEIMLVTNGGQLIRCPVSGIRIVKRRSKGVTIFNTADDEHVVSVERISEVTETGEMDEAGTQGETVERI